MRETHTTRDVDRVRDGDVSIGIVQAERKENSSTSHAERRPDRLKKKELRACRSEAEVRRRYVCGRLIERQKK